jgi:hypothetical protein
MEAEAAAPAAEAPAADAAAAAPQTVGVVVKSSQVQHTYNLR